MKMYISLLMLGLIGNGCNESTTQSPVEPPVVVPPTVPCNVSYDFLESASKVQDRNFYVLTLLEELGGASDAIESDEALNELFEAKKTAVEAVLSNTSATVESYANALKFTEAEILLVATRLEAVVPDSESLNSMIEDHLRSSCAFQQFSEVDDNYRLLTLALEAAAEGINKVIDTYGRGIDPLYPTIDAVSYDVNTQEYLDLLEDSFSDINTQSNDLSLFFQPSLAFAIDLLEINDRDEAGRYFPMEEGVNKQAYDYIQTIDWDSYDYSLILVLGDSPNSNGDLPNISIGGMNRSDHGVELFNKGLAPLMAFSGGHLYPVHTIYSEAIEMKKYVMETHSIPEKSILVDPHARHTTTNMRNIGRIMYRYGIPVDKLAIVSTSGSHSEYVASDGILTRSINEMGHIPFELFDRLSEFDLEFKPKIEVLHLDSFDPLDP